MEFPLRIVLADDHTIVRQGIKLIIEQNPDIKIVGEASNGEEAFDLIQKYSPNVLVCDMSMPKMSGIELARKLTQQKCPTHILFLTMQDKDEYIVEAMKAGALGFLPKDTASEELVEAILKVAQGKEYFSGVIYNKAFNALRALDQKVEIKLTAREKEILQLLSEGASTKIIADKLFVSEHTVSSHRANLLRKMSAQNVVELIRKASELKFIN